MKVRYIDWSPDEWIAGVDGVLTEHEAAIYQRALMAIYSRGGECPNDAEYLATRFKREPFDHGRSQQWQIRRARASLDRLIALGKLKVTPDGQWLTNGRADTVLNKARERIHGTVRAGIASGKARRSSRGAAMEQPWSSRGAAVGETQSSEINDLTRTRVRNHQPSTIISSLSEDITYAPRARERGAPARAPSKIDPKLEAAAARARAKLMKGEP
jgi:hypothetical protein